MEYQDFSVFLDTASPPRAPLFDLTAGDAGNRFCIRLTRRGVPVDLTGCVAHLVYYSACGVRMQTQETGVRVTSAETGALEATPPDGAFSAGMVACEVQWYEGPGLAACHTSARFLFVAHDPLLSPERVESDASLPVLVQSAAFALKAANAVREAVLLLLDLPEEQSERVLAAAPADRAQLRHKRVGLAALLDGLEG